MAKAFRTPFLVSGKEPFLRRLFFEIRYREGYLYLDHCGRMLNRLFRESSEWMMGTSPNTQGTTVFNLRAGTQFTFSSESANLTLDKTTSEEVIEDQEAADFLIQLDHLFGVLLDELELGGFTRIGYREQHHFSFDTKDEAETWITQLGAFSVNQSLLKAFAGTQDAFGIALIIVGEDCRYRIGLNGIERSAQLPFGDAVLAIKASGASTNQKKILLDRLKQKRSRQINSAFAVVLDIDAYLEDPLGQPHFGNFVMEHSKRNLERFRSAISSETPKKGK